MPASKAHIRTTNKWMAKAYNRVNLTFPKGQKEVVQAHAFYGQSDVAKVNILEGCFIELSKVFSE